MKEVGQFLKDYGELISISLIPFIVWYVGIKFQDRAAKKKAKMDLFLNLMAYRKANPVSPAWPPLLNQIDVIFQDNAKVRHAWRAFYDSLNPISQHFQDQNSFHLDLLSEMANDLGYMDMKQTDMDRYYNPAVFSNALQNQTDLSSELLRVLKNSKSFCEALEASEKKEKT